MKLGLIGRKVGMTRVFTDSGQSIPVTVILVEDNRVVQLKNDETDGYVAVQVGAGSRRASRVTKPLAGHYAKAGVGACSELREFRVDSDAVQGLEPGSSLSVELFEAGQKVDVSGITIGKGFSGGIRRHNFSSNRASHGNSVSHRSPGSISMAQDPGRVFPGKKMPGQYGAVRRTVQNLEVVSVESSKSLLLVKGAVPGPEGGMLIVKHAVKTSV